MAFELVHRRNTCGITDKGGSLEAWIGAENSTLAGNFAGLICYISCHLSLWNILGAMAQTFAS